MSLLRSPILHAHSLFYLFLTMVTVTHIRFSIVQLVALYTVEYTYSVVYLDLFDLEPPHASNHSILTHSQECTRRPATRPNISKADGAMLVRTAVVI